MPPIVDYVQANGVSRVARTVRGSGWCTLAVAFPLATFISAYFRTMNFGISVGGLFADATIVGFLVTIPCVMAMWETGARRMVGAWLVVVILCVAACEIWAGVDEWKAIATHGKRPAGWVACRRSWPFEHHGFGFDPASGWWGGD
jgi:hypothetical protein